MDSKDREMIIVGCLVGVVLLGTCLGVTLGFKQIIRYLNTFSQRLNPASTYRAEADLPPSYTDLAPPDYQSRRQSVTTIS